MGANKQQTNKANQPYLLLQHKSLPFFSYSKMERNKINELLELRANIVSFLNSIQSDPLLSNIVDGDSQILSFEALSPKSQKKIQQFQQYIEQFDTLLNEFPLLKQTFVSETDNLFNTPGRFYYNQQFQNTYDQAKADRNAEEIMADRSIKELQDNYNERVGKLSFETVGEVGSRKFTISGSGYNGGYAAAIYASLIVIGLPLAPVIALGTAIMHAIDKLCTHIKINSLKSAPNEKFNKAIIAIEDELLSDAQSTTEQVIFDTQKVLKENEHAKKLCAFFQSNECNYSPSVINDKTVTKNSIDLDSQLNKTAYSPG